MEFKSKQAIEQAIRKLISTDKNHAVKALLRIFEYQTDDEQAGGYVYDNNGVGFTSNDADILTSFAKQYLSKGYLSDKQYQFLFKKIGKYAGQLTRLAIDNGMYKKNGKNWIIAK